MNCCCQKCCEPCTFDAPHCLKCGHPGRAYQIASARHMYATAPIITDPPTKVVQYAIKLHICREGFHRAILSSNCYGTGALGVDNALTINGVQAIDFAGIKPVADYIGKPLEQVLHVWPARDVTYLVPEGNHELCFEVLDWGIISGWTELWLVIT